MSSIQDIRHNLINKNINHGFHFKITVSKPQTSRIGDITPKPLHSLRSLRSLARCLLLAYDYGIVRYGVVKIKEPTNSYHHLGHCFRIKRYKFFLIHKKWQFLRTKKTISLRRQKHHLATLFEKVFIMRFFLIFITFPIEYFLKMGR